jgi:hypothetical protein
VWVANGEEVTPLQVRESLSALTSECLTGAFAWKATADVPFVFTAYFVCHENSFWLTSQGNTNHVTGLRVDSACSLAIWRAPIEWGRPLQGIQLLGHAELIENIEDAKSGVSALHQRFPGTRETIPSATDVLGDSRRTTLLKLTMTHGVLRDEERIGKGKFRISWKAHEQ